MSFKKSSIIILLLLSFGAFSAFIQPLTDQDHIDLIDQKTFQQGTATQSRLLQASTPSDKIVIADLAKIVADSNALRTKNGAGALTVNSNLAQIVTQWAQILRSSMTLTQYLQLYGVMNVAIEDYASIPSDYIVQAVEKLSIGLSDPKYNQVVTYSASVSANNYQVILVFQGGSNAQTVTYSQQQIQIVINKIAPVNPPLATPSTPVSNPSTVPTSNQTIQGSNTTVDTINQTSGLPNQTTQGINQAAQGTNQTGNVTQKITTNGPTQTTLPQVPSPTSTSTDQTNLTQSQVNKTITTTSSSPKIVQQNVPAIIQSTPVQTVLNSTSTQTNATSYPALNHSTPISSLPLIAQTVFNNTTSFANIILYHDVPTTFLTNEIFPFKGAITQANPSGVQVNIIFTRIEDQSRLTFSQYLPAKTTEFLIQAYLNLTGDFYLSIFPGTSGLTSLEQYTIAPVFSGLIVSRPPNPLAIASLNLIGNDLWLNWTSSDEVKPALTQIIFTQNGGQQIAYLLSNYQTSFLIPYEQFYAFNAGTTNIQIAQAFSADQSANSRTSDFSAPYNIIFNATYHNYEVIRTENTFATIPFKIAQGSNIFITGQAAVQLENQILLLTPSKIFQKYYINSNKSIQYVQKGTFANLSINLNETGVYILEINNAGGEALINMPIYVGQIYPLIPDFMDLNPSYIDLAALNQPTLLADRRKLVLNLINSIRSSYGVSALYLDDSLNNLAQNYSALEIQNNFVSHIDNQGNSPDQRAAKAGIYEGVGENLAMNNNLTNAQLMLQRSPAHLQNMVNPAWTRIGLGVLQNSNQFYYLTQEFSSRDMNLYPFTATELNAIQVTIMNYIQSQYTYIIGEDKGLSSQLNAYQSLINRPYIISYLQGLGYRNVAVANVEVSYNNGKFMDLIKSGANLEPTSKGFKQAGVTIAYTSGMLEIFAAYI